MRSVMMKVQVVTTLCVCVCVCVWDYGFLCDKHYDRRKLRMLPPKLFQSEAPLGSFTYKNKLGGD